MRYQRYAKIENSKNFANQKRLDTIERKINNYELIKKIKKF